MDTAAAVNRHRDEAFEAERYIAAHPETGFKEWGTTKYLYDRFCGLGYKPRLAGSVPGFTAEADSGRPGPRLVYFGEMDALLCPEHPQADDATGAAHVCGHNAQCAALLALAGALKEPGALDGCCGSVRLCAVPAEEHIEMEWRESQRAEGKLGCFAGKPEFLRLGLLDGCDIAIMVHTAVAKPHTMYVGPGSNGNVIKRITYHGRAAHAGSAPQDGINALYAAALGISAVNSLRETFPDEQHVRYHPIITRGGTAVNAIPAEVVVETYLRAATPAALRSANYKVNRAIAASAAALGAGVTISDKAGYSPLKNDPALRTEALEAMRGFLPCGAVTDSGEWWSACTDMGDISAIMPSVHPFAGGAEGSPHGKDFKISDPDAACLDPARFAFALIRRLLEGGAAKAKSIIEGFEPVYKDKQSYFNALAALEREIDAVAYAPNGAVALNITL